MKGQGNPYLDEKKGLTAVAFFFLWHYYEDVITFDFFLVDT